MVCWSRTGCKRDERGARSYGARSGTGASPGGAAGYGFCRAKSVGRTCANAVRETQDMATAPTAGEAWRGAWINARRDTAADPDDAGSDASASHWCYPGSWHSLPVGNGYSRLLRSRPNGENMFNINMLMSYRILGAKFASERMTWNTVFQSNLFQKVANHASEIETHSSCGSGRRGPKHRSGWPGKCFRLLQRDGVVG